MWVRVGERANTRIRKPGGTVLYGQSSRRFTAQKFKTASKPDRALRLLLLLLFAVVMVLLVRLSPFVKRNIY